MSGHHEVVRRRFVSCCVLPSLALALSGCGETWRILRILVNPAPLPGSETVEPLNLVTGLSQAVLIETVFERDPSYNGLIQWQAKFTRREPSGWVTSVTGFSNVPPSNHGSAAPIFASCSRVQDASGSTVKLTVRPSSGFDVSQGPTATVTGTGSASIEYLVDIVSTDQAGHWVSARAAKPLGITCVEDVPLPACSGTRQLVDTTAHNGADCGGTSHDYFFGPAECDAGFVIDQCSATLSSQANGSTCSATPAGGCRCKVHVTTPADCSKWADCHVVVSEKPAVGCP